MTIFCLSDNIEILSQFQFYLETILKLFHLHVPISSLSNEPSKHKINPSYPRIHRNFYIILRTIKLLSVSNILHPTSGKKIIASLVCSCNFRGTTHSDISLIDPGKGRRMWSGFRADRSSVLVGLSRVASIFSLGEFDMRESTAWNLEIRPELAAEP